MKKKDILSTAEIITLAAAVVVLVTRLFNEWKGAHELFVLLMGVFYVFKAVETWNEKRKSAIFDLCIGVLAICASSMAMLIF